jgi:ElaB/YqjD/DUF883 family membrane-anchored ribosome-binding protein
MPTNKNHAADVVHDFGKLARHAADGGKHQLEHVGELASDAAASLRSAAASAIEQGEVIASDVEDFIIHRPLLSVAIATGIGILIGALIRPVRYPARTARRCAR